MAESDGHITGLFFRALNEAETLIAMARNNSAESGWQSTDSFGPYLATLLHCVEELLFDPDVEKHLKLCPPSGCTPDGASLPGLGGWASNVSWHHLGRHMAHRVAMTALSEVDADAILLFAEHENEDFEYVALPDFIAETSGTVRRAAGYDENVRRYGCRKLEPGEKRARRLNQSLNCIRDDGRRRWPAMVGSLRDTGLSSEHFAKVRAGIARELREIERNNWQISQAIIPAGAKLKTRRGRPVKDKTAQRVDFVLPLVEKKGYGWEEASKLYREQHPEDTDATTGAITQACRRRIADEIRRK